MYVYIEHGILLKNSTRREATGYSTPNISGTKREMPHFLLKSPWILYHASCIYDIYIRIGIII